MRTYSLSGRDGISVVFRGNVDELPLTGEPGDLYGLNLEPWGTTLYGWQDDAWVNLGDVTGPPGGTGGAGIVDETLVSWTQAEVWSVQSVARDNNGIVESATVIWPDGSAGDFIVLEVDEEWLAVDSYSVSHSLSGKVAVQPLVVRDSSTGQVIEQPAMQVQL